MKRMRGYKQVLAALLALVICMGMIPAPALAAGLGDSPEGIIFNVLDYGADPTGIRESSSAVIAALDAAAKEDPATPKTIYFPKGEYHFYAGYSEVRRIYASNTLSWNEAYNLGYQDKYIGILVENMENVTIDGGGSKLIFHGNICAMAAIDSKNVTFTNFEQDHASPSVVEMLVESVDTANHSAVIYIPPCYDYEVNGTSITWVAEGNTPEDDEPYWKLGGANSESVSTVTFDAVVGAPSSGNAPWSNVTAIEEIDATHLKITYSDASKLPAAGKRYQQRNTAPRMTPGVFVTECDNVTFRDAAFRFLHGFGMLLQVTKDVTYDNVTIGGNTEMGRDSGGFADFIHGSTVAGTVTIKNCNFDGAQDDAINIHGTYLQVTGISADRKTLEVRYMHAEAWGFPQYHVGDEVDFTRQKDMTPVEDSTRTVVSLCNPGEGENMDGTARSKDNEHDMKTIIVTLDKAIPREIVVDSSNNYGYVMENATYTPEVIVENNRFSNINACGILVTTRKPIKIINNYFDRTSNASIYIAGATHGYNESGRVEDLLIQGNTFVANPSSSHFKAQGTIRIQPEDGRGVTPNPPTAIYRNVRIVDNNFLLMNSVYAVNIDNVDGLTVKNNRFFRYDPAVQLSLSLSGEGTISAGGVVTTTLEKSAKKIDQKLFRLETCENVTITNNTYDNGLNLGVEFSRGTTADDVTLTGDDLKLGGDNKLPAVGTVSYLSSDPNVATVNTDGLVTGVKAGTAEICAYTVSGGRMFRSNPVTITVIGSSGGTASSISITGDDIVELNTEATYQAVTTPEGTEVFWTVEPVSKGASASVTQDGVLTANAPGLVELSATAGDVRASKFVSISGGILSDVWHVAGGETEDGWRLDPAADTLYIDALASNSDWSNKTLGRNKIVTDAGNGDFEATVKLTGAPCGVEECMEEAGLTVYKDGSNYVSITRKNQGKRDGTPWLSIIGEKNGSSTEIHMTYQETVEELYLKVKKEGNTYTGYYSTDGTTWHQIIDSNGNRTYTTDMTDYRVGVYAHGGINDKGEVKHEAKFYGYSDFTLKKAEEEAAAIGFASDNQVPAASNVQLTAGDAEVTLAYTFTDPDGDRETESLIAWYAADEADGAYSRIENASGTTLAVTKETSEKWIKAVVAPADAAGHYGAPVVSDALKAPAQENTPSDATLSKLSVGGMALSPVFDGEITEYTVDLPSETGTVYITAEAAQAAAIVAGDGAVTLTKDVTKHVVRVTNGETTKEYTITFRRVKSGNSALASLTAVAGANQITFGADTRYYYLTGGTAESLTFAAQTADPGASIQVRFNDQELGDADHEMTLPLTKKLNTLELRVTPEAGHSHTIYRVVVLKDIACDAQLQSLKINGVDIALGENLDLGRMTVEGPVTLEAEPRDSAATVLINVNGETVENGKPVSLTQTFTTAQIRVVAENGVTDNVYTLELVKQDASEAALYSLALGDLTLVHDGGTGFDPDVMEYTAVNDGTSSATLHAVASQDNAVVSYETVAEYKVGQNGAVSGSCSFFGDVGVAEEGGAPVNTVLVTVTSPDGQTTKTYTIRVTLKDEIWLSDLDWEPESTTGWANHETQKDYEISGAPLKMTLLDPETKEVVTFDKGLGTHANCETIYDISGMGITRFTAKVGLDHSQASNSDPAVKGQKLNFEVIVDGEVVASANQMAVETPYAVLDCSIPENAQKLTLKATYTNTKAAGAHADWADAKLYFSLAHLADLEIPVQYLGFAASSLTLAADQQETYDLMEGLVVKPSGAAAPELTWASSNEAVATVDENGLVRAMAEGTATITAASSNGITAACAVTVMSAAPIKHTITLDPNGGTVGQKTIEVEDGETASLPTPNRAGSYRFLGWFDENGDQVTSETPITRDMTLTARWQYTGGGTHVDPEEPEKPVEPTEPEGYIDVAVGQWYYDAVSYVTEEDLMTGVGNGKFNPDGAVTRAMVWTVLARMDGEDTEGGATWYSKAQAWAMETGVSDGTNPMGSITREQLAAMLYRYEGSPAVSGNLNSYPDAKDVSDWAVDAMVWATEGGIINGMGGFLKPKAGATRAQLAAMLMRFVEEQ